MRWERDTHMLKSEIKICTNTLNNAQIYAAYISPASNVLLEGDFKTAVVALQIPVWNGQEEGQEVTCKEACRPEHGHHAGVYDAGVPAEDIEDITQNDAINPAAGAALRRMASQKNFLINSK